MILVSISVIRCQYPSPDTSNRRNLFITLTFWTLDHSQSFKPVFYDFAIANFTRWVKDSFILFEMFQNYLININFLLSYYIMLSKLETISC